MEAFQTSKKEITDALLVILEELQKRVSDAETNFRFFHLSGLLIRICENCETPLVLMIAEVDSATNNQVFLNFLAQLRSTYLKREKNLRFKTFHAVILAGVTDIKNLKRKPRPEDAHKFNSPWNIAADFEIDMSLWQIISPECWKIMKPITTWECQ